MNDATDGPKVTACLDTAKATCDALNGAPLPEGKDKRVPFKVYSVTQGEKVLYAVAQAPATALHIAHIELGISVEMVGAPKPAAVKDIASHLAKLSPEQLAEAKKYLGLSA